MASKIIRQDFNGLNQLVKALSDEKVVRVGILGKKAARHATGAIAKGGGHKVNRKVAAVLTNAELGAVHEFGSITRKIVPRSFLRMPIHRESDTIVRDAIKGIKELVKEASKVKMLRMIGLACENAIQRAFATAGFGSWKADKSSTVDRKKSSKPLIDTAQLRRSISSDVADPA